MLANGVKSVFLDRVGIVKHNRQICTKNEAFLYQFANTSTLDVALCSMLVLFTTVVVP